MRLDVWTIRSLDEGKTWVERRKIVEGWSGANLDLIQTSTGRIVLPIQDLLINPGGNCANVTYTLVSDDDGRSWKKSNIIDLGGHGHHDGAFEQTLVELRDGRLWMLMRTNWDRFWQAYSTDQGLSWRVIGPSEFDASSSPGYLTRLSSGRLVLVWNRLYPEGKNNYPRCRQRRTTAPRRPDPA